MTLQGADSTLVELADCYQWLVGEVWKPENLWTRNTPKFGLR